MSGRFDFEYEWIAAADAGIAAPELAATWARLEIRADDEAVTRVEDVASGSSRRSIYCSLYPLAEWIAYNWWPLRGNYRLAGITPRRNWAQDERWRQLKSHNLRFAGDGFIWPNLTIIPQGESTRAVWLRDEPDTAGPVRYISDGVAFLDPKIVERALGELVDNVLTKLREANVPAPSLEEEWSAVRSVDPDEANFCMAAARLGLDPYALEDNQRDVLEMVGNNLPADLLVDFLDGINPAEVQPGVLWLKDAQMALRALTGEPVEEIGAIRRELARASFLGKPWQIGWQQARCARSVLSLDDSVPFEFDSLLTLIHHGNDDRGLVGLGGLTSAGGSALVAAVDRGPIGDRFAAARALWHIVTSYPPRFLVTDAHTDRQKAERAFAAELLAPASGLEKFFDPATGYVVLEDIDPVADHFRVSPLLISHQVENQLELEIR